MKAHADLHLAGSYIDRSAHRFDVACEGERIDSFRDAMAALRFARWSTDITGCAHEIIDRATRAPLVLIEPAEFAQTI